MVMQRRGPLNVDILYKPEILWIKFRSSDIKMGGDCGKMSQVSVWTTDKLIPNAAFGCQSTVSNFNNLSVFKFWKQW